MYIINVYIATIILLYFPFYDIYEESDLDACCSELTIYEMLLLAVYKLFALLASDRTQRSPLRPITLDAL